MSGRLKPNAAYIEVREDLEHRPDPSCRAQQPAQWLSGLDALKRRHFDRKVDLLLLAAFAAPAAHDTRDLGLFRGEQLLDRSEERRVAKARVLKRRSRGSPHS